MSHTTEVTTKAVPAQLGFIAIYNPSLGTTDETLPQQIVYYASRSQDEDRKRKPSSTQSKEDLTREEQNEQLRQIGLAQGMVEFGRSFSDGKSIDTIETEKSKIILHELETGWWILASIDLTRLPSTNPVSGKAKDSEKQGTVEYSSREVKPAILLLGDLLRAHATFLLHHASSMSALFVRNRRSKFTGILSRYWDTYLSNWNVLMHGNPANNLYGGIKIAACGELGVGVGEEERGSGEREALEGFVGRIEGLVDILVSKFGDGEPENLAEPPKPVTGQSSKLNTTWLGSGNEPSAEDGMVFLGTGALSRKSIRDVSHWMEDLYKGGPHAYGVVDNPSSNRRAKQKSWRNHSQDSTQKGDPKVLTPDTKRKSRQVYGLSIRDKGSRSNSIHGRQNSVSEVSAGEEGSSSKAHSRRPSFKRGVSSVSHTSAESDSNKGSKIVQYLKMGYGTHWTLGSTLNKSDAQREEHPTSSTHDGNSTVSSAPSETPRLESAYEIYPEDDSVGHYLIGLLGDVDAEIAEPSGDNNDKADGEIDINKRTLLRTLTVELERAEDARPEADISIDLGNTSSDQVSSTKGGSEHTNVTNASSYDSGQDRNKTKRLRVVVYVRKPFIFVLLFELRTDALSWSSLYRSLHNQITPLIKPLLRSTSYRASKPEVSASGEVASNTPIYDLVWDPRLLTIHSTIPNIPDPYQTFLRSQQSLPWSRIEALNTHMQIINTYIASTTENSQMERTCKTSRGWWVVWTLIPDLEEPATSLASGTVKIPRSITEDSSDTIQPTSLTGPPKIKSPPPSKSSTRGTSTQHSSIVSRSLGSNAHPFLDSPGLENQYIPHDKEIFLIRRASDHTAARSLGRFSGSLAVENEAGATSKLVQGIGVDTKRYIDALLNLTR
ncbi:hypothetical protein PVAG01_03609 [Phlyctema vagabunda]|uniref:CCZ1/INTU/HSP4 first Longin domain-containing protein n=1 Tax=Phlyctema vagabunda TaxID=108571 RepID=A0ABR4PLX0_9HELO